jgi:hypothetical protein
MSYTMGVCKQRGLIEYMVTKEIKKNWLSPFF